MELMQIIEFNIAIQESNTMFITECGVFWMN